MDFPVQTLKAFFLFVLFVVIFGAGILLGDKFLGKSSSIHE